MAVPAPVALLLRVITNTIALFSGLLFCLGTTFLLCKLLQDLEFRLLSANRKHRNRSQPLQPHSESTDASSSTPSSSSGSPKAEDTVIHHVLVFALMWAAIGYIVCLIALCVDHSSFLKTVLNSTIGITGAAIGLAIPVGMLFVAIGIHAREEDWNRVWRQEGFEGVQKRVEDGFAIVGGWAGEFVPRDD